MIISVRAKPRSKKPGIEISADGLVTVRVTAAPVDGKANDAIGQTIAQALDIPASLVRLLGGGKSKLKRFEIPDSAAEKLGSIPGSKIVRNRA